MLMGRGVVAHSGLLGKSKNLLAHADDKGRRA